MNKLAVLSGNRLKLIAVVTMLIDHFSKTVLICLVGMLGLQTDRYNAVMSAIDRYLCGIGRISFPLFCFLLAEGFYYTKNRRRYLLSMLIFAVLSEMPFDLLFWQTPLEFSHQNVYFTLFLALCALQAADSGNGYVIKTALIMLIAISANIFNADYGMKGVLYVLVLYILREKRIVQVLAFLIVYVLSVKALPSVFILISAVIMLMYNGERGTLRMNKYVFYLFYPLHLLVLWLACVIFG